MLEIEFGSCSIFMIDVVGYVIVFFFCDFLLVVKVFGGYGWLSVGFVLMMSCEFVGWCYLIVFNLSYGLDVDCECSLVWGVVFGLFGMFVVSLLLCCCR